MNEFNAILAEEVAGKTEVNFKRITLNDLPDEDVLVKVDYSTLNYKDGLALGGKSRICRTLPLICGIDLAGTVVESKDDAFVKGDKVLVNGFGLSELHNGGYSQFQRLKAEWLVKVPNAFSLEQTMAIGTAGYTSMLSIQALLDHGVKPEDGPVLVTGASGGVGSISVKILSQLGYQVTAATGRVETTSEFLKSLGASDVISRESLQRDCKPLEKEVWAAVVDSVGDTLLATAISQTKYEGIVTACGLAGGIKLPTTVMPFILRGVTLRGIDSVMASQPRRQKAWDALAKLVDVEKLTSIYELVPMSELIDLAPDIIAGKIKGRVVVDVNK